ncbi:hypothetical protein N7495_008392 [Penicillium taxi]|uniref:uncharacterized protein n=1 Tax=Penicillium taxi TaxID=168475 RepID=UPI002544E4F9|nr:uncharacterized protein N7495_008392 [Penicillium taxi]KAJ5888351.1 hypothetical protein N7495_008392 [Penicillium taxi]
MDGMRSWIERHSRRVSVNDVLLETKAAAIQVMASVKARISRLRGTMGEEQETVDRLMKDLTQ